jgi:hypothetical protein
MKYQGGEHFLPKGDWNLVPLPLRISLDHHMTQQKFEDPK